MFWRPVAGSIVATCLSVSAAFAHAFGQRYDLPIPLWLYLAGAGAVVVVSFLIFVLRARTAAGGDPPSPTASGSLATARPVPLVELWRVLAVAALAVVVAAGIFGNQDMVRNIAPIAVWVVLRVAVSLLCGFLGDIWSVVNPWAALHRWFSPRPDRAFLAYPPWLGAWPGVILLLGFAWAELLWEGSGHPHAVAWLLVAYSALTWLGMTLFGRATWLAAGEIFAIAFSLFARCGWLVIGAEAGHQRWRARRFAAGLLDEPPYPPSRTAFILVMLASVSFDGLSETPAWSALLRALQPGDGPATVLATLGLLALPPLYGGLFIATVALSRRAGAGAASLAVLVGSFAPTLLPIALAYHLAHNQAFLLLGLQYLVPLLSDPLGLGWDLFGTALYMVDFSVVSAVTIWYVAVAAIVVGHVVAVYLVHVIGLRIFPTRAAARRGEIPLALLMIFYTMTSLWLLAQPITNSRAGG